MKRKKSDLIGYSHRANKLPKMATLESVWLWDSL